MKKLVQVKLRVHTRNFLSETDICMLTFVANAKRKKRDPLVETFTSVVNTRYFVSGRALRVEFAQQNLAHVSNQLSRKVRWRYCGTRLRLMNCAT